MRRTVRRPSWALLAVATAIVALGLPTVALGALPLPVLVSPHNAQRVHKGQVKLIVKVTMPGVSQVAIQITPKSRGPVHGTLPVCVDQPCDRVLATPWHGHPNLWIYMAHPTRYNARHYWADTPGKYYWQAIAQGFNCATLPTCELLSRVGTFTVTR
jgi:hypothetical protein